MSLHSSDLFLLFVTGLAVLLRSFSTRRIWSNPLAHGPGFFFTIEVAPGFYQGPGVSWLRRYRNVIVAERSVEALALLAVLGLRRWEWLPMWAGACALLSVATIRGFTAWAHHALGRLAPVPSSLAVSLDARRLSDYISWPAEALAGAIVVASWLLLLAQGDAQIRWKNPILLTYVMLGLILAKFAVVGSGFPLPAERIEEHQRWVDAHRRSILRRLGSIGWFCSTLLGGYALLHGWPPAKGHVWFRWLLAAVALGVWLLQVAYQFAGTRRLDAAGRNLRPPAGWSGASSPLAWLRGTSLWWGIAYVAGLVLLLVFVQV